jgi:hypothetical protein
LWTLDPSTGIITKRLEWISQEVFGTSFIDPVHRIFWTQSYFSGPSFNWIGIDADTFSISFNITDKYASVTANWDPITQKGLGLGLEFINETYAKRALYSIDGNGNIEIQGIIEPEIYFIDFGGESAFDPISRNLFAYLTFGETMKTYLLTINVDTLQVTNAAYDFDCSNNTDACPWCLFYQYLH